MTDTTKPLWKRITDFPLVAMLIGLALAIGALTLAGLIGKMLPPLGRTEVTVVRVAIAFSLLLASYKFAIVRLGSAPRDDLRRRGAALQLPAGVGIGAILFGTVVGIAALIHVYSITGPGGTSELVVALVATAIMPGFVEELLFRGILFRWIEEFGGTWAALVVTSALFGLAHILNPGATWLSSLAITLEAGILLGGAYMLTRNLWLAMGIHAGWNFTQGEIFDVPVSGNDEHGLVTATLHGPPILSGGAFGLEASVIAMVVATGAGILLVILAVRRGHVVSPMWVRRRLESQEAVGVDVDRDADLPAPLDPA